MFVISTFPIELAEILEAIYTYSYDNCYKYLFNEAKKIDEVRKQYCFPVHLEIFCNVRNFLII